MLYGDVRLAHSVGLTAKGMLDEELGLCPCRSAVDDERTLETTGRVGFLRGRDTAVRKFSRHRS